MEQVIENIFHFSRNRHPRKKHLQKLGCLNHKVLQRINNYGFSELGSYHSLESVKLLDLVRGPNSRINF